MSNYGRVTFLGGDENKTRRNHVSLLTRAQTDRVQEQTAYCLLSSTIITMRVMSDIPFRFLVDYIISLIHKHVRFFYVRNPFFLDIIAWLILYSCFLDKTSLPRVDDAEK